MLEMLFLKKLTVLNRRWWISWKYESVWVNNIEGTRQINSVTSGNGTPG